MPNISLRNRDPFFKILGKFIIHVAVTGVQLVSVLGLSAAVVTQPAAALTNQLDLVVLKGNTPMVRYQGASAPAACGATIDSWVGDQEVLGGGPINNTLVTAGALGGERDLALTYTSGASGINASANAVSFGFPVLEYDNAATRLSRLAVAWDGVDGDATTLNPIGLGGIDLTANGNIAFTTTMMTDGNLITQTLPITMEIYDISGGVSHYSIQFAPTNSQWRPLYVPFAAFSPTAGGGADFSKVGAIALYIDGTSRIGWDVAMKPIQMECNTAVVGTGILTITKTMIGTGSGPFTVTVNGPDSYITTTTIDGGQTRVITGLEQGIYTVTETSPGAGWVTTYTVGAVGSNANAVVTLTQAITAVATAPGTITGTIYQDYNGNGAMDTIVTANTAVDVGVAGIRVAAYDRNGVLQGAATSDAFGVYTLTTTTSGPYRLELGALPAGYEPSFVGAQHGSGVQFANAGDRVGFAINRPSDYAQGNPPLASSFFSFTTAFADKNPPSVVSFDINTLYGTTYPDGTGAPGGGFRGPIIPSTTLVSRVSLGNVNGLTWQRGTRSLYAAAYARVRAASLGGTGLGPGGLGAIYRIDMSSGTPVASLFATVPNVGSYTSNNAAAIAKVGLGDVQISEDEQTLYAINVFGRALVSIPATGVPPVAGAMSQVALPQPTNCATADTFPFALGRNAGKLYIGMVCSGPAMGDLRAYVYEYDGAGFALKLSIPLNYARANVNANWDPSIPAMFDLDHGFRTWDDAPTTSNGLAPMLTSIVFDRGDMVLGFRSRLADQFEESAGTIGGEILRACSDSATAPTTWVLENNGVCGGRTTFTILPATDPWSGSPALADTTLGPGGAEFYFGDNGFEGEAVNGSLAQIPGMNGVYVSQVDAVGHRSQFGLALLSHITGTFVSAGNVMNIISLANARGNYHANAMGDLEFLFDQAPLQIGNRVWNDVNGNGIQDPGELGINGLTVSLQTPTTTLSTVTAGDGNYLFGVAPNTLYRMSVSVPTGYYLTQADANGVTNNHAITDVRDSDAALVGNEAVIYYTTGSAGQSNHGLDVGFTQPVQAQVDIVNDAPQVQLGDRVWIESDADGLANTGTITSVAGMVLTATNGTNVYTTTTDAQGYYSFTVPAATYIVTYGDMPVIYGPVDPSLTPGSAILMGSSGSYAQSGNPDQSHPQNTAVTLSAGERNWQVDFGFVRSGIGVRKYTNGYDADAMSDPRVSLLNGQAVTWTYVMQNTGNAMLGNIQLSDDRVNTVGASCAPVALGGALTAGQITTCTLSSVADVAQTVNGVYSNTATMSGTHSSGAVLTASNPSHYEVITPSIALRKYTNGFDADAMNDARPQLQDGQVVMWTYVMTNTGTIALNNLTLADDRANVASASCAPVALGGNLALGQVTTCTLSSNAQAVAAAADGVYTNTAVVTGTPVLAALPPPDLDGFPTPPSSLAPITASNPSHYEVITPALQLVKYTIRFDADALSDARPLLRAGDGVTWTYVITNAGNVALAPVVLIDDVEGAITCPQNSLAVGASMTCTKIGVAQLGRVDAAGIYTNVAVVTGTPPTGPVVTATNPSHYQVVTPSIGLVKYTNGYDADTVADVRPLLRDGDAVVWTYVISNTGNLALGNVQLSDDRESAAGAACAPVVLGGTLAVGGVTTCTLSGTAHVTQTVSNIYTNTATTMGTPVVPLGSPALPPLVASNPSHYEVITPSIQVRKYTDGFDADLASDPQPVVNLTETVTWTFVVTNTGSVALRDIALVDDQEGNVIGGATCSPIALGGTLLAGQAMTCTLSAAAKGGQYVNNAVVYGTPVMPPPPPPSFPIPPPLPQVTDTNPSRYYGAGPGIELRKYTNGFDTDVIPFDPQPYLKVGDAVTWTYVLTNTGNVTLTNVILNDDVLGGLNGNAGVSCAPLALNAVFGLGAVTTCTLRGVANVTGQYTNTAVVTATNALSASQQVTDSNPSHYYGSVTGIELRKYTNGFDADAVSDPHAWLREGDVVVWTYVITNTGNVDLQSLVLADDRASTAGVLCAPVALGGTLAVGGVTTCTLQALANAGQTVSGMYSNTAVVTGTPPVPLPSPTATNISHYEMVTPSVRLVKYTNGFDADRLSDPQAQILLNGTVTWTYFVTNTGNITLSNLKLVDDREGAMTCPQNSLAPEAAMVCLRLGVAGLGQYTNTAVVTGTPVSNPFTPTLPGAPSPTPFTPVTGTNPSHYFGVTAGLGDFVWEDIDHDGYQDASEPSIAGVTVRLLDANGAVLSTTTNSNGYYSFTQLMAGVTYVVAFDTPTGYTRTVANADGLGINGPRNSDAGETTGWSGPVVLGVNEFNPNIDAGFWRPTSLGDYVWRDDDVDGLQDAGESGIAGVTVNLLDGNGAVIRTTTTDAQGYYSFTNLISGTYSVGFVAPSGYQPTVRTGAVNDPLNSDASPTTGRTPPVVLYPGDHNPNLDAGYWLPASLGDRVWNDVNANGIQDTTESGVPGVQVVLYSAVTGAPVATTTTSLTGTYLFTGLVPGNYFVGFGLPVGFVRSPQDGGGNDAKDSDSNVQTGLTVSTTLNPGENDLTWDEGIYQPASLGDYVWLDKDADGLQDADELPMQGVTVALYENGTPVLTTTTSITGYYTFLNLKPNVAYSVSFGLPTGYAFTTPNVGNNDKIDSDANRVTGASPITILEPGEHDPTLDAGIWQTAGLGNYVWLDVDRDGVQESGESAVAGVTVTLYRNGVAISTTTTNSAGFYSFTQLMPGVPYTVQFSLPSGYMWTQQGSTVGSDTDSNVNANGATAAVTLQSGEFNSTIDAGVYSAVVLNKVGVGSGTGGTIGEDRLVTFTLVVENKSNLAITNVVISDPLSSDLDYVLGSFVPEVDEIVGQTLIWRFAAIEAGGKRTIRFVARLVNGDAQATVVNTAYALQQNQIVSIGRTEVPYVPTAITLARFEVSKAAQGLKVIWQTSMEQESYGFHLYRSQNDRRREAVRVTGELIPAMGRNGGASYAFVDVNADANQPYVYWLQETELSGATYEYGPVRYGELPVAVPMANVVVNANAIAGGVAMKEDAIVVVATPMPTAIAFANDNAKAQGVAVLMATVTAVPDVESALVMAAQSEMKAQPIEATVVPQGIVMPTALMAPVVHAAAGVIQPRADKVLVDKPVSQVRVASDEMRQARAQSTPDWPYAGLILGLALIGITVAVVGRRGSRGH